MATTTEDTSQSQSLNYINQTQGANHFQYQSSDALSIPHRLSRKRSYELYLEQDQISESVAPVTGVHYAPYTIKNLSESLEQSSPKILRSMSLSASTCESMPSTSSTSHTSVLSSLKPAITHTDSSEQISTMAGQQLLCHQWLCDQRWKVDFTPIFYEEVICYFY